jgi:hypothetical protein
MTADDVARIDLADIAEIEEGGAGIRITFKNGDREFVDGGAAERLLERWRARQGVEDDVKD